jgi:hypothetical protein
MTDNLTPYAPPDDDGFNSPTGGGRLIKGIRISWNQEWTDADGCAPPSEMLAIAIKEVLQRWQDGNPTVIATLPLPDPDVLNEAIPVNEWEIGLDNKPTPPWAHNVVVYYIDPKGGGTYTYISPTVGGHIAVDQLHEAVKTKRFLEGAQVVPLVRLSDKPMKTRFGMKSRPHFEIVDWRSPGNGAALPPAPPPLQLQSGAAPASEPAAPEPAAAAAPAPAAEAQPPRGTRGKITVTSGRKKNLEWAVFDAVEARRPDLKPDPSDDIPF